MSQSGGGGRRAALGEGTLRESQARRGHPQPPTQVPPPRHSHDGQPRAHGAMIEGTPRPCISLQWRPPSHPRHCLPGLPTPHPGENRLHPLPAEPHRRGTAALSRALGRAYLAAWVRI